VSEPKTTPKLVDSAKSTSAAEALGVPAKIPDITPKDPPSEKTNPNPQTRNKKNTAGGQNIGGKKRKTGRRKAANNKQVGQVVEVAPIAQRAHMRGRHWGLISSFLMFVIVPLVITFWYLQERAVDQYASTVAFTVQQQGQSSGSADLLNGFAAQVGGSGGVSDTDILYEFIQSQQMVASIDDQFDLISLYSATYDQDPIFSLPADATLEDLVQYWSRVVRISYDEAARLIELRVLAYDPETAQAIAQEIVTQSQLLINDLNIQAREDTIQFAEQDLDSAEARLSTARTELIFFRTSTQIVDPETDLAGRLGVVNTLQQQLAEALVEYDLLAPSTSLNDPRVVQAQRRIDVIRARLAEERANVTQGQEAISGEDYPTLLAQYEGLVVSREIAEQMYRAALTSLDVARADASRQSRYLSAYIQPTLAQTAEFPQRMTLFGLAALFIVLSWSIAVLIYYSVRDSR
jgi:capsular polysaccharide transport system permease protein